MTGRALDMRFIPEFANVDLARGALQGICRELFEPEGGSFTDNICLAATEALNNAVEHSGSPVVELKVTADRDGLTLRLTNSGVRFDPTVPASMPDDADNPLGAEGGYGLALVQQLVDSLEYAFRDGKNVLTMYKRYIG
ncbi:MAG: ATP-binding protein [Desulfuromonadales bacterium]|nr:ATP-binding protein [Desulfuromonadales bacterium]